MEDIISALENIEEQGSFCEIQTTSIDKLKIEIKEFGLLKLPLSANKAKALLKHAKPAKFGWRDQTLLDKTVRHAWEIPKSHIKIDTTLWNKELKSILDNLKKDLGLPDNATLKANLHNLLIYEPGQFFSAHQDSEKCDGRVASLVIVIPSAHRGGTLMIDHQGEKKQFQTSRFSLDKLTCIAFYADCHHEVKEVKEGYRVTLTYNLILEQCDLPQLGINIPAITMRRFWMMLAHYHGQIWNAAEFSRAFGMSDKTVRHYLDILSSTFIVKQLTPWWENISKRQIKSPMRAVLFYLEVFGHASQI